MNTLLEKIGEQAVISKRILACSGILERNAALLEIAQALLINEQDIIKANKLDIENGKLSGMSDSLLDRLALDSKRIKAMSDSVLEIISVDDPIGKIKSGGNRPNGLKISCESVPLGVIAIIYEARPNVSSDAAALCLKAGNAVILRGGKEAINSNKAIVNVMRAAVEKSGLPADSIQLVEDTSRETAADLMKLKKYIDVLIPRGGAGLIKSVVENASVPVIETGVGNCHIYIDKFADIDMAASIVSNAKTSRPSVCNACESLLVHEEIAEKALPEICKMLRTKNVEIRGDERTRAIISYALPAAESDWYEEYNDYILAVKVVKNIDEAVNHIAKYSSGHSEAIITESYEAAEIFTKRVDSAAVYVNASTRFTDGGEFGFGAEIGISTQKLHARGPLGLEHLTSLKYVIHGNGQIR